MRRILVCTGVLGGGTAVVFALAAATATIFPNGTVVNRSWDGMWRGGGLEVAVPEPMPMPAVEIDPALVDPGIFVEEDGFEALPGDTLGGTDEGPVVVEPALP